MTRSDVTLCSWNSPAHLTENTGLYLSHVCPPNSPVDYRICALPQERVYIVQTPACDTSRCDQRHEALKQRLIDTWASISQTSSTKQLVNGESSYMQAWRQMTSLWTSATLKPTLFRANTLHNRLCTNSLPKKTPTEPTHYTTDCFQSTEENVLFWEISIAAI